MTDRFFDQIFVMCNREYTAVVTANSIDEAKRFCDDQGIKNSSHMICLDYHFVTARSFVLSLYRH